jgi:AraC-like DNA-binding protein
MLHHEVLARLCHAREMLRETDGVRRSVEEVAREAGMSKWHFIRLFRTVFGQTPNQCQVGARLARARRLLVTTDRPVTEVCMEVGYASLGTFSHEFKRRVGMTPSRYRDRYAALPRASGELPGPLVPGCFTLMGGRER